MGWLFQGNPEQYDIDEYMACYPELIYWRTPNYSSDIAVGDRVFMWRSAVNSGVIAIGSVVELPTIASKVRHPEALGTPLWKTAQPDPSELKTGIHLDDVRLTMQENMIPRDWVKNDPVLSQHQLIRAGLGTVFKLTPSETEILERMWGNVHTGSNAGTLSAIEGALRAHFRRERSSKIRANKLEQFRSAHGMLYCEVCGEKEQARYPKETADRIFEVHHLKPLAQATAPILTTLDDLAILCANCHRAIHTTHDVDENFALLTKHFGLSAGS